MPLVANVLARPITEPDQIRRRLVEQVTGMVRWSESVGWLTGEGGVAELVETRRRQGADRLRQADCAEAAARSIGTPADVDAFVAALGA